MIFKRLLGRKRGRTSLPKDQDDLIRVVQGDQDAALRRDACRHLTRLPALRELASSDADAGVRDIALARYRDLLCGQVDDAPVLNERLDEIATLQDQRILERVAVDGGDAEARRGAIAKIANPVVLATCALNDNLAANRAAAIGLLDDKQALEHVVKNIGKKDKRVYRAARQKLRDIVEREALPQRVRTKCEELCEKLERLGRFGHWVQDRAMLDLLDRQWAEIEPEVDQDGKERFQELRSGFLSAYGAYRSEHKAQIAAEEACEALRSERQTLMDELHTLAKSGDESNVAQGLAQIDARWEEMESLPEKEQVSLERQYAAARKQVSDRLEQLAAITERNARMRKLLQGAEKAMESNKFLDRKQIRGLLEEAQPLLGAKGADKGIDARFAEAREALDERLRKQKKHAEQRLAQLPAKLDELERAIDNGSLREAEPISQSVAASIELIEISGLPHKYYADASARLKALAPRIRELQKWRRWGTDQTRQELCATMEELISTDISLEAMTLRLHYLQMEWKGLDKEGSPANHPLWERFHAASERVYQHCKPYLDEQAAEREANRQQREQLCRELEEFLEQVDWERMDWKKASRAEREMRQAWSTIGPVEGRLRKELERRFRGALKRLDGRLSEERSRNQAHKRELIAKVESLVEEPDIGRAVDETKRLQREWSTTVPARQKEENRLWRRFRAACDAVFARRQAQQEAHTAELVDNLKLRRDLCLEAEKLAASEAEAHELAAAMNDLEKRWRNSEALPVPRQTAAELAQSWREARGLVERRRRERLEEQRRKDLDLLADQAALCEGLERTLRTQTGTDAVMETAETHWKALPRQRNEDLQGAIERRFNRVLEALRDGGGKLDSLCSELASEGKRRAELCLQLEILAEVDSPPDLTRERLQFQVTRLTERMREGEKDPLTAASRLLQEWYLCGPASDSEAAALEERFLRARSAIEKADRDNATAVA